MKISSSILPIEVLSEIADYLPTSDIPHLAVTSRPFNGIATRLLYRQLALRGFETVRKCFETLAFNEGVARCVKELYISIPALGYTITPVLGRTFRAGFKNLESSLVRLSLSTGDLPVVALLKRLHFPHLTELLTMEILNGDLAHFLESHPGLEVLAVGCGVSLPTRRRSSKASTRAPSIHMPELQAFRGSCEALPILIPNSKVDMVEVLCGCRPVHLREDSLIETLCSSSLPVRKLAFIGFPYSSAIFDLVKGLTHLTALAFTSVSRESWAPGGAISEGLSQILPHLPTLYRLDIVEPNSVSVNAAYQRLVEDYTRITRLASLRESLCIVSTHSRLQWGRLKQHGSWLPLLTDVSALRWWFMQTGMLTPLQFAAFSIISSVEIPNEDEGLSVEQRTDECFFELRRATARIVNEAFALRTKATTETADPEEEKFQVPIHGGGSKLVPPYTELDSKQITDVSCKVMWDEFVAAVGYASLFTLTQDESMELLIQTMTTPDADIPIPVLDDTKKELFTFALDVLWCSIYGVPMRVAQHLQIPEDHEEWKDLALNLPVRSFSAQLQRNIGANMDALNNITLP
ncbi:hypothetical protein BKA70DRAFT_1274793 [Coprinopsis sp. MPI-PUGE-AT-0042]|nr:hypothetical protein BKA70DRAFT_1274793 [Coprinopsis sp. MPI-PUGE-AT-0042]